MLLKRLSHLFVTYYFLCISCPAVAQDKAIPLVSGKFKSISTENFLIKLEQQTGFHFYFDASQLDSSEVDIEVNKKPLPEVLKLAFANTNIGFAIDAPNVFISKGQIVHTQLPGNFLVKRKDNEPVTETDSSYNDYATAENEETLQKQNSRYAVGEQNQSNKQGQNTITGFISDRKTEEPVIGASVHVDNTTINVATDQYGYYTISLPVGVHTLSIQSVGMKDIKREIMVYGNGRFNIEMQGQIITLKRVVVSAEKVNNIKSLQMGVQNLDIKTIKQVPVAFGEADVLKVVLTLPGVKSVGEASTGLNVRGGSTDQNLILFNESTIYNPSHFFGLFSAFNPEVIKNVELFKSSVPAKYGGRLSSVLEINTKEGNKKNISGSAGIGLLTSRLTLEGPLIKDKSSFIIGARTTYANWLLNLLPNQYKNSKAGFYDFDININHEIDKKNSLFLTAYMSKDHFNLNSDTSYKYGNNNISLKWKHIFNNKLYFLVSGGYDNYQSLLSD